MAGGGIVHLGGGRGAGRALTTGGGGIGDTTDTGGSQSSLSSEDEDQGSVGSGPVFQLGGGGSCLEPLA